MPCLWILSQLLSVAPEALYDGALGLLFIFHVCLHLPTLQTHGFSFPSPPTHSHREGHSVEEMGFFLNIK